MKFTKRFYKFKLPNKRKWIVINSITGAVDVIDENLMKYIISNDVENIPLECKKVLKKRGYLFNFGEEERVIQNVIQKYENIFLNEPLEIVIYPTFYCNLACPYCYIPSTLRSNPSCISHEIIDVIFKNIPQLLKKTGRENVLIVLMGGEPLLPQTTKVVSYILTQCKKYEYLLNVITNGTFLSNFLQIFIKYQEQINYIQVTLDGIAEVHNKRRKYINGEGSFNDIVNGIRKALKMGFKIIVRINIDNYNIFTLKNFIDYVMDKEQWNTYPYFYMDIAPVTDYHKCGLGGILDEFQLWNTLTSLFGDLINVDKKINIHAFKTLQHLQQAILYGKSSLPLITYCEAMEGRQFVFAPTGKIYSCPEASAEERLAIGKIKSGMICIDWRKWKIWKTNVFSIYPCKNCEINTLCGGGCLRGRITHNYELEIPKDCKKMRKLIEEWLLTHQDILNKFLN